MLVDAVYALSGGLYTYFVMRELLGGTSEFIMCYACLYVFSQINSSFLLLSDFNKISKLSVS